MRRILEILLVLLGLLSAMGQMLDWPLLRSIGTLTVASPLPLVFTEKKGVETFALDFYLLVDSDGRRLAIEPGLYDDFHAPYAYRNVVGAAFSYGPILPKPMVRSVLASAFRRGGELRKALGLKEEALKVELLSRTRGDSRRWILAWEPESP